MGQLLKFIFKGECPGKEKPPRYTTGKWHPGAPSFQWQMQKHTRGLHSSLPEAPSSRLLITLHFCMYPIPYPQEVNWDVRPFPPRGWSPTSFAKHIALQRHRPCCGCCKPHSLKSKGPSSSLFKNIGLDINNTNAYQILMSTIGYTTNSYRRGVNPTLSKLPAVIVKVSDQWPQGDWVLRRFKAFQILATEY